MFAAASGMTSGSVAAGLFPPARSRSPADVMTHRMKLACKPFSPKSMDGFCTKGVRMFPAACAEPPS